MPAVNVPDDCVKPMVTLPVSPEKVVGTAASQVALEETLTVSDTEALPICTLTFCCVIPFWINTRPSGYTTFSGGPLGNTVKPTVRYCIDADDPCVSPISP